jgi:hypothetical protein
MAKVIAINDGGYVWHVPLQFVANHRAAVYANDPDTTESYEIAFVMDDDYEGIDWFQNNMNWEDVASVAVLVQTPDAKTEPDISESDTEIMEAP